MGGIPTSPFVNILKGDGDFPPPLPSPLGRVRVRGKYQICLLRVLGDYGGGICSSGSGKQHSMIGLAIKSGTRAPA